MMAMLALALPATAAVLIARAYWPPPQDRVVAFRTLQVFLAAGVGLGLSSCAFFLWYPLLGHPKHGYVVVETVACLVLIVIAWRRMRRGAPTPPSVAPSDPSWTRWLWIPFVVSALLASSYLATYIGREPHGHWDAFSIWNLRARSLFRADDNWTDTFAPLVWHADYPLFLSATVARTWCYLGEDSTTGPILVTLVMLVLTVGTLVAGLNYLRGNGQGWLAGTVLLATFPFVQTAGYQYADVPLSYFFLAAVMALAVRDQTSRPSGMLTALAGAAAGFAAWTKNEGLLFLAALVLGRTLTHAWNRSWREFLRELIPFTLGLLPAALTLLIFKLLFAPPNDLVAGQGDGTLGRLFDWSRHEQVGRAVVTEVVAVGPYLIVILIAYALLRGRPPAARRLRGCVSVWLVFATMMAGYYVVYVTTPYELSWHLSSSLIRLVVQLWPLFLFALFMTVNTLNEPDGCPKEGRLPRTGVRRP